MVFDIHRRVFEKESGQDVEQAAFQYREELLALFDTSVEGKTLANEGIESAGWADIMMDLGADYLRVTVAQMSVDDLRMILFELIPRKITAEADQASEAIRELQLFWTFLQREFHLENAATCLHLLEDAQTERRLQEEMENPENFGMAKSLMMKGMQRGFDVTTQEGLDQWIAMYNAQLRVGTGTPVPLAPPILPLPVFGERSRRKTTRNSSKRKMAKSSRKRNRGKK